MRHYYCLLLAFALLGYRSQAQSTPTYRARFRYIISQRKLNQLATGSPGITITDAAGTTTYTLCGSRLRALLTNNSGTLSLDPWAISDTRINPAAGTTDPCYGQPTTINAATANNLVIRLPARPQVGNPTIPVWLPYQTWIFGVNTIGLKYRPSAKDDKDSTYTNSFTSGSFNLGFNAGYSFGWTKFTHRSTTSYSLTPGLNLGFSGLSLTSTNTRRKLPSAFVTSNFVFSPAVSLTAARNDVGLILTAGIDHMAGRYADLWIYQNQLVFGLGIVAGLKL